MSNPLSGSFLTSSGFQPLNVYQFRSFTSLLGVFSKHVHTIYGIHHHHLETTCYFSTGTVYVKSVDCCHVCNLSLRSSD